MMPPSATNEAVSLAIFSRSCAGDISSVRGSFVLALPCTFSTASLTISSFLAALSARAVGLGSAFGVALDGVDLPTTLALPPVAVSTSIAALVSRLVVSTSSALSVARWSSNFFLSFLEAICSTTRLSISVLAAGLRFFSTHRNVALVFAPPVPLNLATSEVGMPS